ncbi:hypothetical protein An13g01950 [Aspergillus niger]|uniref:Uncharacterized protein n=2 Tax=Aspergillus niger TaxID=5061 RepID=A2R1P4_ASPNC|nr:hypothetical protein An13g01950 [Aspergillus niger]CAK41594.1 hypothetical protein An13g01950 [Aspergillus niger]
MRDRINNEGQMAGSGLHSPDTVGGEPLVATGVGGSSYSIMSCWEYAVQPVSSGRNLGSQELPSHLIYLLCPSMPCCLIDYDYVSPARSCTPGEDDEVASGDVTTSSDIKCYAKSEEYDMSRGCGAIGLLRIGQAVLLHLTDYFSPGITDFHVGP